MGTLADLAESGDADALSAAIADGAHLDEADDEGNTATHKAAQGEPECLRLLLSHGATVDSANAESGTPVPIYPPDNPSSERRLRYCAGRLRHSQLHHKVSNDLASRLSVLFELVCLSRRAISPGLRT